MPTITEILDVPDLETFCLESFLDAVTRDRLTMDALETEINHY